MAAPPAQELLASESAEVVTTAPVPRVPNPALLPQFVHETSGSQSTSRPVHHFRDESVEKAARKPVDMANSDTLFVVNNSVPSTR